MRCSRRHADWRDRHLTKGGTRRMTCWFQLCFEKLNKCHRKDGFTGFPDIVCHAPLCLPVLACTHRSFLGGAIQSGINTPSPTLEDTFHFNASVARTREPLSYPGSLGVTTLNELGISVICHCGHKLRYLCDQNVCSLFH